MSSRRDYETRLPSRKLPERIEQNASPSPRWGPRHVNITHKMDFLISFIDFSVRTPQKLMVCPSCISRLCRIARANGGGNRYPSALPARKGITSFKPWSQQAYTVTREPNENKHCPRGSSKHQRTGVMPRTGGRRLECFRQHA